ncbi:hypothetical protein F444_14320 [Phytophthora nicotianae P1976]|uniref:Uncharacterized protein n=1 Tax=Phytophthora nicotianae P1976 TaxID=1317066 RepID=A0A080ZQR7_PHYNI|nr:hypothetical protein F444_14320 [Phytophthora nicotianae P1976]
MPRPRTTGTGRKKKAYNRIAVDYSHKLQILERLEDGDTVGEVISAFYPNINKAEKKKKKTEADIEMEKQANFIKSVCEEGKGRLENYRRRGDATVLPAQAESNIVL